MPETAIELNQLSFSFDRERSASLFDRLSIAIPKGARVLLVGANGVGKSTLLQLLGGKHLIPAEAIRVFRRSPFHDLSLASRIGWVGGELGINLDIRVGELLETGSRDRRREKALLELFEIPLSWRMCRVSDGQRKRVQLLLGLRRATEVILLDEVTAHLDVTMRSDLLRWLKADSRARGATLVYATHIFDGLDRMKWPSHVLWLGFGGRSRFGEVREFASELKRAGSLGVLCERWIRANLTSSRRNV